MVTDLYRHFNKAGELLYVGISLSAVVRLSGHRNESGWYDEIKTVTIEKIVRGLPKYKEFEAIRFEQPKYNRSNSIPGYPERLLAVGNLCGTPILKALGITMEIARRIECTKYPNLNNFVLRERERFITQMESTYGREHIAKALSIEARTAWSSYAANNQSGLSWDTGRDFLSCERWWLGGAEV